ncbi:MAG TPA: chromate transporter [Clostridiales bacterium]|nr:chromate transporter [Clostridiales bacterium]
MLESGKGLLYNLRAMNKFKKALLVFWSFFKIGLFTFGGGYAMISVISAELVERRKWITQEDMTDMLIISEMTPGAIAVNSATFVGYRVAGVLGGILGTLGVVLPSLIIITVLSFFVHYLEEVAWLAAAFKGIQAVVVVLIVNAMVKFFKQLDKNWQSYLIAAAALIVTLLTDFNVIFLILAGGIYGIVYTLARDARKKKLLEKNLDGGENAAAEEDGAERVDQACVGAEESGEDKQ